MASKRLEAVPEPPPERETPTQFMRRMVAMQHEERMAQATRPGREDRPSFVLKRSTASGSLGVIGIDVSVPVCEEFPTAEEAFEASCDYMDRACARYPLPDGYVRAK